MLGRWDSFRKRLLLAKRQQHRCKGARLPSSLQILGGIGPEFQRDKVCKAAPVDRPRCLAESVLRFSSQARVRGR